MQEGTAGRPGTLHVMRGVQSGLAGPRERPASLQVGPDGRPGTLQVLRGVQGGLAGPWDRPAPMQVGPAGRPGTLPVLGGAPGSMAEPWHRPPLMPTCEDSPGSTARLSRVGLEVLPRSEGVVSFGSGDGGTASEGMPGPFHGPWLPSPPYAPDQDVLATTLPVTHDTQREASASTAAINRRAEWSAARAGAAAASREKHMPGLIYENHSRTTAATPPPGCLAPRPLVQREATATTATINRHAEWSAARAASEHVQQGAYVAVPVTQNHLWTATSAPPEGGSAPPALRRRPRRKVHPDPLVVLTRTCRRAHMQRRLERCGDEFQGDYCFTRRRSEAGSATASEDEPPSRRHRRQPSEWWIVTPAPAGVSMDIDNAELTLPSHSRTRSRRPAQSAGTPQGCRLVAGGQK